MRYELYTLLFPNGKRYFGISCNSKRRFSDHVKRAKSGNSFPVSCAIRKFGAANVKLIVICVGERDYIAELEIKTIAAYQATDRRNGYNLAPGGDLSPMHSPHVAAKVSATKRQRVKNDPEYRERLVRHIMTPAFRQKAIQAIRAPEARAAKSRQVTGRKHSASFCEKVRQRMARPEVRAELSRKVRAAWSDPERRAQHGALFRGRPISTEQRAKISATLMGHPGAGKGVPRAPEVKAKISAAKMGHTVSPETRAKIRAKLKGTRRWRTPVLEEIPAAAGLSR